MDLKNFAPGKLSKLTAEDFDALTKEDIAQLAKLYPNMNAELLIVREGTDKPRNAATYRSLNSLLFSGQKFKIIGTMYVAPTTTATTTPVAPAPASQPSLAVDAFVAPESPIFLDAETTTEQPVPFTPEISTQNPNTNVTRKSTTKSRSGRSGNNKSAK